MQIGKIEFNWVYMKKALIFPSQSINLDSSFENFLNSSSTFTKYTTDELNYTHTYESLPFIKQTILIAGMLEILRKDFNYQIEDHIQFTAGYSLGEFIAVAATNTIALKAILNMLKKAEDVAIHCIKKEIFASVALIGLDIYKAYDLCLIASGNEVCQVACHNSDKLIIASGHINAIERLKELTLRYGVERVVNINFDFPFHCQLMRPVAEVINMSLQNIEINLPSIPIVFNYSANTETRPGYIKSLLFSQICHTVLWQDSIKFMLDKKIDHFIEFGPGNTLTQINKKIAPNCKFTTINSYNDIKKFVEQKL